MKVRELRESQRRTGNLYDTFFTRRVSIYVTAALLPLGITPNAVSLLNLFVGMAAWTLVATATHPLVGVLLIHAYAVLDSVDGEIARLTGRYSLQGLFLEDYSAYVMINGYWIAMGVYLSRSFDSLIPILAALAMVAFGRNAMPAARRALLKSVETGRPLTEPEVGATEIGLKASGLARRLFVDVLHPANVWAVTTTVLAIELFIDRSPYALLATTGLYFVLSILREMATLERLAFSNALDVELARLYSQTNTPPVSAPEPLALAGDTPTEGSPRC